MYRIVTIFGTSLLSGWVLLFAWSSGNLNLHECLCARVEYWINKRPVLLFTDYLMSSLTMQY